MFSDLRAVRLDHRTRPTQIESIRRERFENECWPPLSLASCTRVFCLLLNIGHLLVHLN